MVRTLLKEKEFDQLTSGEIVTKDGVQIALSDIGYHRMLEIIKPKYKSLWRD